MATKWFYKQFEQEQGPYTFHDLVEMVREEKLTADVLVRPDYLTEWQRADSVVGLFHMAHRDPETISLIQETVLDHVEKLADNADIEPHISPEEPVPLEEAEKPGWLRRLLTIRSSKIPVAPLNSNRKIEVNHQTETDTGLDTLKENGELGPEPQMSPPGTDGAGSDEDSNLNTQGESIAGAFSDETWSSAIDAAVERIDARAPKPEEEQPDPKQIVPKISLSLLDAPLFRKILQISAVVICASLAIYGFVNWMGQGTLHFPLIGACSPLMFLVYSASALLGVMILGPLLIYFSTSYLRMGFRLGSVIVTASVTIYYLLTWPQEKTVVFPGLYSDPAEPSLIFPIMGECSSFAYWMYFFDVVLFVAVLTYFVAWWLEAHADDV